MNPIKNTHHSDVLYMQADINYTICYLSDGRKVVLTSTLKKFEQKEELCNFLRVNKSYLLNPDFIKNCYQEGKKATIELVNGKIVEVSRRKMGLVKQFINI